MALISPILLPSYQFGKGSTLRGIEWSLRAFTSMQAVCLFLRAQAVVKFFLQAVSTLGNTDGEQRAL